MDERRHDERARTPEDLARLLVTRQRAGDAEGMARLYEVEAVMDGGDGRLLHGRGRIEDFYRRLIASGRQFEFGVQRPALINGGLALTSTKLPNGAITAEIARRQADGTWLWWIDQPLLARLGK